MAILAFLFRMRVAILAMLGLASAGAAWVAFHGHPVPAQILILSGASLVIAATIGFLHVRHFGLAVLGALAPLPGMIAAGPFAIAGGLTAPDLLAIYGMGAVAAACLCGGVVRRILDASAPDEAARDVLARSFGPATFALLTAAALIVGWLFRTERGLALGSVVELAAALLSVLLFVPFVSAILRFGEPFFVTANRVRERRETFLGTATLVVEPRWGFAVSGAVLVLATLGWFGAEPVLARNALLMQPVYWAALAMLVFLVAFATARDWRDALAATLALAALMLFGLYVWGRAVGHLTAASFVELVIAVGVALSLMLNLIAQSRRYRQLGDVAAVARLRAIEDAGWAPWFGVLSATGACAPWLWLHGSIVTLVVLFPLAGAAASIGMPALATALDSLVPRRRTHGELYGRG